VADADPARRALTPVEEARLFAGDALRAARTVMSGNPATEAGAAYLAVFAILAAAALGVDVAPEAEGTH
jgi:hypothetical protein